MSLSIRHLFVSAGHNFFGRHGQPAGDHPIIEVGRVECVAGKGLIGDRFFNYKPDYKGQITLFAWEVYQELREDPRFADASPAALRRNAIVEGFDLNALIGKRFWLQGIELKGTEECRPCYWMDRVIGPGAETWLKGRGGLRCKILNDGVLTATKASASAGFERAVGPLHHQAL
jgi:MOSC domain-containing protein YiiM